MNVLSDSESSDSDTGRRFKTESTRAREDFSINKKRNDGLSSSSSRRENRRYRSRSRSRSKSRSRERYTRKRSRSREKSHRNYERNENIDAKSSKRHGSRERKQNDKDKSRMRGKDRDNDKIRDRERDRDRDKDKERDRDKERSSHQSSSSKSSEKYRSSSSHKMPHSKRSNSEDNTCQNSNTAIDTTEKYNKHKKDKEKHRDECSKKSTDNDHKKSNDKQSESIELSSHKRNANIHQTPERNGNLEVHEEIKEHLMCGPSLPPHMMKMETNNDALSPNVPTKSSVKTYGPSLPRDFIINSEHDVDEIAKNQLANYNGVSESDGEEIIGPVLDHIANKSEAYLELEKRALELKLAKLNEYEKKDGDSIREREEWMTELPELRSIAGLGLTARQFRTKERDEIKDRSSWTETPRDREEKQKRKSSTSHDDVVKMKHEKSERIYRERRDAEQEDAIRKHKKKHKRDESLLDIHQKKMKKNTQEKVESSERRPFSRDTDLNVNRFDEAQKKSILKKAQLLDTRFGSGQSKYL